MSENAAASFTPPNLVLATVGLSLATFMQVLDTTIANVALPTIAGNLGVSSEQGTWVITSFAVSNAIALPLTGWMSRRVGRCACSSPPRCCSCWRRSSAGWPSR